MNTELLYNISAYTREFTATVISSVQAKINGRDCYDIVLDRTAFFPEQGGQDCDSGIIVRSSDDVFDEASSKKNENILHVSIKDGVIHHFCTDNIESGFQVFCRINWEQRFDRMQQHSGEHLVSGTVHRFFGADNVGFHLSGREVTLDFNTVFEEKDLDLIEDTVNRAIFENIETIISFPAPDELEKIDYRSKKELTGQVRIVEYPGYDICACCAPHVERTGEIGCIRIAAAEHFKGGTRMWIECGQRALLSARTLLRDARSISRITSAKLSDIVTAVNKLNEDLKSTRFELVRQERIILAGKAGELAGKTNPILITENADPDNIRPILNELAEKTEGYCTALTGNDEKGYRFITTSKNRDCRELLNGFKASLTVKGGGNAEMIQGTIVAAAGQIEEIINGI